MQSDVTAETLSGLATRLNIPETEFERRGVRLQLGLPITCAATIGEAVAVGSDVAPGIRAVRGIE